MKAHWIPALLLLLASISAQAWTPPADPNPEQILKEARADAKAGRLDDAAAKHRWYHDKVLGLMPSHAGVRLSFALSDWVALARRHPPAMVDLRAARDRALAHVEAGDWRARSAFQDLVRLNEVLDEPALTRDAFALLAQRQPGEAELWLSGALPALVETKAFELAAASLKVEQQFERLSSLFASLSKAPRAEQQPMASQMAKGFVDRRAALVVLTLNQVGQQAEAERFAARCRDLLGGAGASPLIDAALRGEAPPAQALH